MGFTTIYSKRYHKSIALKGGVLNPTANKNYLQFMYERLIVMRKLLSDTGSIYLHCDWHRSHHLRILMDEVFGFDNFRNEIAWCYAVNKGKFINKYPPRHDTILFYAKTKNNLFNAEMIRMPPSKAALKRWGPSANYKGEVPFEKLTPGMKRVAGKGEKPYILRGGIQVDWLIKFPGLNSGNSSENTGYPTQKPESLIEMFIKASSNPADIVFDCFMGSGTTQAAAMKLGRRFIGADINPDAVQTAAIRLVNTAKKELVKGEYPVPDNAGIIRIKITNILSESLEIETGN